MKTIKNHNLTGLLLHTILLPGALMLLAGCGSITVRHVPKVAALSGAKMSDLHGSKPIDVKSGQASSEETSFGAVGMGKVVGRLSEWTEAAVGAVRNNLSARGATITPGAPKALTITMTKAEVTAIPLVGVTKSKIVLTAATTDGLNSAFEGSSSSIAPLGAVDGAVADAIKKLLGDSAIDTYLRK